MQLKQLEYLVKIAECGSISQAAQRLFISQPSLTKSIMRLEEEYEIKILERKPRGIELTVEGKSFVHYAKGVLAAANALSRAFYPESDGQKSRLFLGTQQFDFVYDLFLQTYWQNQERNIHYNLVEADRNEVTKQVLNGEVDLGIIVRSNSDAKAFLWHTEAKRLDIHVLDVAGTYVCLGPKSPYYALETVTFSQLSSSLQIVLDMEAQAKQNLYFDSMQSHFNENRLIFFNTISACEVFLMQADAVLYIAKWAIGCFQNSKIRVLRVVQGNPNEQIPINELLLLRRAGEPLNRTEMMFLQYLNRHCEKNGFRQQEKRNAPLQPEFPIQNG